MNILFFSSYYYPYTSGLTTYPQKLFTQLGKKNKITVLTFPHSPSLSLKEHWQNQTIIRMPYQLRISKGFLSFSSLISFFTYVKKTDVVILNIPNAEGLVLALLARIMRKPIISIFHCEVDLGPSFTSQIISFFLRYIVFIQLWLSTCITAYTKSYISQLHFPKMIQKKIEYIFPFIDVLPVDADYKTQLLSEKKDHIWIGFAGRSAKEKGLTFLIKALQKIQNKDPQHIYELICAGPYGKDVAGEEQYYFHIISLLKQNKIPYRFLGNLHAGKLGAFYHAIDVLVLPSLNKTEAFGMVQVDAILQATPVVASSLPGVDTVIKQTHMGLLTAPGNSNELAAHISEVISHKDAYITKSRLEQAQSIFNSHNTLAFYEHLLEDIRTNE